MTVTHAHDRYKSTSSTRARSAAAMKVTLKTLTGSAFEVMCEPTDTVAALKQKIASLNSALPAEHTVTVFQGKVLADAATLADSGVSEQGFVVVMVKKPAAGACSQPASLLNTGPRPAAGRRLRRS